MAQRRTELLPPRKACVTGKGQQPCEDKAASKQQARLESVSECGYVGEDQARYLSEPPRSRVC